MKTKNKVHLERKRRKNTLSDPRLIRDKLVPTSDDWAPSYDEDGNSKSNDRDSGGFVKASCIPLLFGWRVCFWGADDCGYEDDFETYEEAKHMFDFITNVGSVSIKDLEDFGFHHS